MQPITVEATAPMQNAGVVSEHEWQQLELAVIELAAHMQLPLQVGPFDRKVSAGNNEWRPPTLAVSATFR